MAGRMAEEYTGEYIPRRIVGHGILPEPVLPPHRSQYSRPTGASTPGPPEPVLQAHRSHTRGEWLEEQRGTEGGYVQK